MLYRKERPTAFKKGDKKTPKGTFKIENLYFRKDRLKKPQTKLNVLNEKLWVGRTILGILINIIN